MGSFNALGGGRDRLRHAVPVRPDDRRVLPRARPFPGRPLVRRQGARFSIGFGPELAGFNDRHGTRWKMSAIPLGGYVKFFGDENAASVPDQALPRHDVGGRAARQFHPSAGRPARGHRRRRADRQFHAGDRHFCRHFHDLRQADHERAGRRGAAGQRGGGGRIPARRSGDLDRWRADRELLRHAAHRQHQRRRDAVD